MPPSKQRGAKTLRTLLGYATGEGAGALAINGIENFAMLYYTQALGLRAQDAGFALSITLIWDAIIDPVVGHLTDNTRSRFGSRHPFILLGGLAVGLCFYLLWSVPGSITETSAVLWYVVAINMAFRTAVAIFLVPYTALGFEICRDYDARSRLQSVRFFFNQAVNFLGGALAWSIFFRDKIAPDGTRIDGTKLIGNYAHMGAAFSTATVFLVCLCVFATRSYASDNRSGSTPHNSPRDFVRDFHGVITDKYALHVFAFFGVVSLGTIIVSQVQMFTYVNFMRFTDLQKTIVHGAGMIAFAAGSLAQTPLVTRFDKKQAGYLGMAISVIGSLALVALFSGRLLRPDETLILSASWAGIGNWSIPIATLAFAFCQALWWGGNGVLVPLATSMVADVSGLNYRRTGLLKDGSYSAIFSFVYKSASGIGLFINGWALGWAGFVSGVGEQAPNVVRNIALMTFLTGPLVLAVAFPILWKYPIDRALMRQHENPSSAL